MIHIACRFDVAARRGNWCGGEIKGVKEHEEISKTVCHINGVGCP